MAKNLEMAKKHYKAKTKVMGKHWKERVTGKESIYAKNMAEFLGIPSISTDRVEAWKAGTDAVSAEDFTKIVTGKEDKWARRLLEAFKP